jgi:hypothetical protein
LVVLVAVQLFVLGVYLPPVFETFEQKSSRHPPQTIISLPVQTAVCQYRAAGAFVMLVAVHVSSVHGGPPSGILPELWGRKKASNVPADSKSR